MNKVRFFTTEFICFLFADAAAVALAFCIGLKAGVVVAIFGLAAVALYITLCTLQKVKWQRVALQVISEKEELETYVNTAAIPMALTTESGKVRWCNTAFRKLGGFGAMVGIASMIDGINVPNKDKKIFIGGRPYKKERFPVRIKNKEMMLYRLINIENTVEAKKLYQSYLPVVCFLQIDNYDELSTELSQIELSEIVAAVERRIALMAKNLSSIFMMINRGKYLCLFERRFLSTLRSSKFKILNDVRAIKATLPPTLSIAIGVGETSEQSGDYANKALELALGRGGDQAVIKRGDKFDFFGGTSRHTHRRSKVKSRMISHALRNLMEQCADVYVMGHEAPDLDCLGASLGICACARHIDKKAYVVVDAPNASIEPLLERLAEKKEYAISVISGAEASANISASSLLVVVDTQHAGFTVAPSLLELADTVVVIDHHLRGTTNIEKTALYYHEPYASSACELVTEVLQYFDDDIRPLQIDLEALLCGIIIDTKGFSFNTGVRTFEAASYLRRHGADSAVIRQLVQDDLETYTARTDIVKKAEIMDGGVAVARCKTGIKNAQLIAAQAADALLTIRGIRASFVISELGGNALISGRSLGDVNVQLILEKLGGGGHSTIAAAKMDETDISAATKALKKAIKNQTKEDI